MSNGCISLVGKGAGLYLALCVSAYYEHWGIFNYYSIPFVFYDLPSTYGGRPVSTIYDVNAPNHIREKTSACITIYQKQYLGYVDDLGVAEQPYLYTPNAVWQTFKSGLRVTDFSWTSVAQVVKVIKLT